MGAPHAPMVPRGMRIAISIVSVPYRMQPRLMRCAPAGGGMQGSQEGRHAFRAGRGFCARRAHCVLTPPPPAAMRPCCAAARTGAAWRCEFAAACSLSPSASAPSPSASGSWWKSAILAECVPPSLALRSPRRASLCARPAALHTHARAHACARALSRPRRSSPRRARPWRPASSSAPLRSSSTSQTTAAPRCRSRSSACC